MAIVLLTAACAGHQRHTFVEDQVARLMRDVKKVRFAISTTKTLIARARGAGYTPDLYNRLAELYIEQARYYYQIALEKSKNKSRGVVSVQTRLLKNQAIATYRRLLAMFPKYPDADKVLFFTAHEMRELGDYQDMLRTYQELADKYPRSKYRLEGLLVMGDYYFDKARLDEAEKYYKMVLQSAETRVHAMARYKLAWCRVNRADFKGALKLFEGAISAARKYIGDKGTATESGIEARGQAKLDLRREALVDSVFCYTEVYKPQKALSYFRKRADSKTTYLAALDKLGNRYYVRQNWKASAMVYREILALMGDFEDAIEYAHRLFESVSNSKSYEKAASDVEVLVKVLRRRYYSATLHKKEREKLYDAFEKYTRYMGTKLQDEANRKHEEELYLEAAHAYEAYLQFFDKSKHAGDIRANLAETLYSANRRLEAGKYYELAAQSQKGNTRRDSAYTAVVAYFGALKDPSKLSRLDAVQARAGLRRAGRLYIKEFGKASNVREVKFNIARTYYDAGEFDEAIRYFTALVEEYPSSKEAPIAAQLVLDCYRGMEDFDGLIAAGKRFGQMGSLGDAQFKSEIAAIVQGAEENLLRAETIKAGEGEEEGTDKLEQIAEKYKGTSLGKKALLNAFVTARNSKDPERVFEVGEKLRRAYPKAKELPDALSTMGKIALDSLQFARGATYLEAAAQSKRGSEAADLYEAACKIRVQLGDRQGAERTLNTVLRLSSSAEIKADLAVQVAQLHIEANDWGALVGVLQRARSAGAASSTLSYMLGYALFRQGQLVSAQEHLGEAVRAGAGGSPEAKEAAAAAQFYLAEIGYKTFESTELSNDLSQLGATLQQKLAYMSQTREAYTAVGKLGSAVWTVAALGRLASVDRNGAEALRSLALPDGLPEDAATQVRQALETQAAPLDKEATQAIRQCATAAKRLKVMSAAAKACLAGEAAAGDPQEKVFTAEIRRKSPKGAKKLQKRLASHPNDRETIEKLGRLYLKAGDPYMARMILGKGLELKETASTINMIAVATARLGNMQRAYALLGKALKHDAGYSYAKVNRAAILAQFGYRSQAKSEIKRVRNIGALDDSDPELIPGALKLVGGGA